jgi:GNAT superfamily N-acetyltransferase
LKNLEEHHAEYVADYWPYSESLEARRNSFRSLIKRFHSVGIFTEADPDTPVAWCMQHNFGQLAHLYVTEKYRRQGLAKLLVEHIGKRIQDDGLIPEANVEWRNTKGKELMKKMGFVEHEKHMKFFSISNKIGGSTVF